MFRGTVLHPLEIGIRTAVRRRRYLSQARTEAGSPPLTRHTDAVSHLRRDGYHVIPNYYSAEFCAELRAEIDRIIAEQPDIVQLDDRKSDFRVHGSERASTAIRKFYADAFCREIGEAYFGAPLTGLGTLAGRLRAISGNLGSGQGWHRDSLYFQYKALIYLTDVQPDNGPFQLIHGSHRLRNVVVDTIRGRLIDEPRDRLQAAQVKRIIANDPGRLRTFTGGCGTLILFDSSTIHTGSPIQSGTRYALTNYYYPPAHLTPAMYEHFAPYARP
jgi:hypothetical protein